MTALFTVAGIIALAFWQKSPFLYLLAVAPAVVYGLTLAAGETNGSPLWVAGVTIAIIGMYCLFKVVIMGLGEFKRRRE